AVECALHERLCVHADPGQLRQVLWNLVVNAAQAMPNGGAVRIEARPSGACSPQDATSVGRMDEEKPVWAEITVLDQGAGIAKEIVDRVFDPFFTTKAGGTVVVVMTAYASTETAIAAMKEGAYDYITKPFKVDAIRIIVEKAIEKKSLSSENRRLRSELRSRIRERHLIGTSRAMQRVID